MGKIKTISKLVVIIESLIKEIEPNIGYDGWYHGIIYGYKDVLKLIKTGKSKFSMNKGD